MSELWNRFGIFTCTSPQLRCFLRFREFILLFLTLLVKALSEVDNIISTRVHLCVACVPFRGSKQRLVVFKCKICENVKTLYEANNLKFSAEIWLAPIGNECARRSSNACVCIKKDSTEVFDFSLTRSSFKMLHLAPSSDNYQRICMNTRRTWNQSCVTGDLVQFQEIRVNHVSECFSWQSSVQSDCFAEKVAKSSLSGKSAHWILCKLIFSWHTSLLFSVCVTNIRVRVRFLAEVASEMRIESIEFRWSGRQAAVRESSLCDGASVRLWWEEQRRSSQGSFAEFDWSLLPGSWPPPRGWIREIFFCF